jgi:hypothetical protein
MALSNKKQIKFDLVIEIRGGVLVGIYKSGDKVPVAVVDWDREPDESSASIERSIRMTEIPKETRKAVSLLDTNTSDRAKLK